jgi:hypothetical protein
VLFVDFLHRVSVHLPGVFVMSSRDPEKRRLANQRYRLAHPDRVKESANRYAEKINSAKRKCQRCGAPKPKQYGRRYCLTCSSILAKETARKTYKRNYQKYQPRRQQYRRDNPEKIAAWKRISYLRHYKQILARQKQYQANRREWINARRRGGSLWFWHLPQTKQCEICSAVFFVSRNVKTCSINCRKIADRLNHAFYRANHPEMRKQYYRNNRDSILMRCREYAKQHRTQILAKHKEYARTHREEAIAYRQKNRDAITSRHKEYIRRNIEKVRAWRRASYYRNRDKIRAHQNSKRANPIYCAIRSAQDKAWRLRNAERKRQNDRSYYQRYSIALGIVRDLGIDLPKNSNDRKIAAMKIVHKLGLKI